MVVNKKGGNKAKKQKKPSDNAVERELVFKDITQFQEYAQVTKTLGNKRFELTCFDGKTRLGHARGSLKKKKVFVKLGDVVLVSLREFEDAKCDILDVYTQKEVKSLKSYGEIPNTVRDDLVENTVEEDIGFDFDNGEEEDIDEEEQKKKEDFKKDFELNFESI